MNSSSIGACTIEKQEKMDTQMETAHVYVKVFFSILQKESLETESIEATVADALVLHDIVGTSEDSVNVEDKIHETVTIDCSDLMIDDNGQINDAEGQLSKILEAVDEVCTIIEANREKYKNGIVHVAIFGFDIIEDTANGFAYIVDQDNSLNLIDEKLASYILSLPSLFDDLKYDWFIWTDYIGVFEYYMLYQPLRGNVSIQMHVQADSNTQSAKITNRTYITSGSPSLTDDMFSVGGTTSTIDSPSQKILHGRVEAYFGEDTSRGWLDTTQLVLDGVGLLPLPLVSEITSLTNGLIYIARAVHAGRNWNYETMKEYCERARENFVGAIPGASLVKGVVRIRRIANAVRIVERSETALVVAQRNQARTRSALNRIRNRKTSRSRIAGAKENHRIADQNVNDTQLELQNAIEQRNLRLGEAGITIGDLTCESRSLLQRGWHNYQNYMHTVDDVMQGRLPRVQGDMAIDALDYLFKNTILPSW